MAPAPWGAPQRLHTNRPANERSARQEREPHCVQTDDIANRSVIDRSHPWLELQAVEAWIQSSCVFHHLTLSLRLGEHTAILGPNGSGKSTLVRLIDRSIHPVVKPKSHLRLFGSVLPRQWELRQRIGLVSTELEQHIPPGVLVRDLVLASFFGAVGLRRDQQPSDAQRQRVDQLLVSLNLRDLACAPFRQLSDGQRRRALIARALAHQPQVLVLDEPTNALDLKAKHDLLASLRRLSRDDTTLVVITHQVETLIPEINRVVCLKNGALVDDGPSDQILTGPKLSALFDTPLQVISAGGYRQVLPLT